MVNCVMCGSPIPENQGSSTCSMCYGDPEHGKDGYYREWLEREQREPDPEPMRESESWIEPFNRSQRDEP